MKQALTPAMSFVAQFLKHLFIPQRAFVVYYPAPFVEIFYHIDYVNEKQFSASVRFCSVIVNYSDIWPINGLKMFMHAPCYVNVFGIHKESFIK